MNETAQKIVLEMAKVGLVIFTTFCVTILILTLFAYIGITE